MKIKIIVFFLLSFQIVFGQSDFEKRTLRVWKDNVDTIQIFLKRYKNGEVKKLIQKYYEIKNDTVFVIQEYYKKNKYWELWRYREILKKEKKRSTIYENVMDGSQYSYNEKGKIILLEKYNLGKLIEPSIQYNYYTNGEIKYIAEVIGEDFYNFLSYKFPNGEDYDFGDYKNGIGTYINLNEEGEPCLECTRKKGKKFKGKILCEEEND